MARLTQVNATLSFALIGVVTCTLARSVNALQLSSEDPERVERFYQPGTGDPAKNFIGAGYDWSGIGRADGAGGWAVLISDQYYLTASHARPLEDSTVIFYAGDSFESDTWQPTVDDPDVASFGTIINGNPDLMIGKLSEDAPPWIKRYPLLKRNENTEYFKYVDPTLFIVGWGTGSWGDSEVPGGDETNNIRVGLNSIGVITTASNRRDLSFNYDPVAGFGDDEAKIVNDDSGGPSFAVVRNQLVLAGIHYGSPGADHSISANLGDIVGNVPETVNVYTDLASDFNGDFRITGADLTIMSQNFGSNKTHAQGDANGNGSVTGADLALYSNELATISNVLSPADFNLDTYLDASDLEVIADNWNTSVTPGQSGDADFSGQVDGGDVDVFTEHYRYDFLTPPDFPYAVYGDFNGDDKVTALDVNSMGDLNNDNAVTGADYALFAQIFPLYNVRSGYAPVDLNMDAWVGPSDAIIMMNNWGQTGVSFSDGDINGDNLVGIDDLDLLMQWWGYGLAYPHSQTQPIPEPATAVLLLISSVLLANAAVRRRQK